MDPNNQVPSNNQLSEANPLFLKCVPKTNSSTGNGKKSQKRRKSKKAREMKAKRDKIVAETNAKLDLANNSDSSDSGDNKVKNAANNPKTILDTQQQTSSQSKRKYTASQSLRQQLQRSKSNYNNSNINEPPKSSLSNNLENSINDSISNKIVKSASSISFATPTNDLNVHLPKSNRTLGQLEQKIKNIDPDLQPISLNTSSSEQINAKITNGHDQNELIYNESKLSFEDSRSSQKSDKKNNNSSFSYHELENIQNPHLIDDQQESYTTNDNEKRVNSEKILIAEKEKSELMLQDDESSLCAVSTSLGCLTADFRENLLDNNNKILPSTSNNIIEAKDPIQSRTEDIKSLIGKEIEYPYNSEQELNNNELDSNAKDDSNNDKYINLFVIDNATNHLQRSQILVKDKKQHQQRAFSSSKNNSRKSRGRSNSSRNNSSSTNKDNFVDSKLIQVSNDKEIAESVEVTEDNNFPTKSEPPLNTRDFLPTNDTDIQEKVESTPPFRSNNRLKLQDTANIISVQHQASQQLLANTNDDDDDISVTIRNDASTEELCNIDDDVDTENRRKLTDARRTRDIETTLYRNSSINKNLDSDLPSVGNTGKALNQHKALSNSGSCTLQTVDEKAENNIEDFNFGLSQKSNDKTELENSIAEEMPANILTKTPGYSQRYRPPPTNTRESSSSSNSSSRGITTVVNHLKDKKLVANFPSSTEEASEIFRNPDLSTHSIPVANKPVDAHRVKFADDNLISGAAEDLSKNNKNSIGCENLYNTNASTNRRSSDHPPQMPSITEVQYETELEQNVVGSTGPNVDEQSLSIGLDKVKLSNLHEQREVLCNLGYRNEASENFQQQQNLSQESLESSQTSVLQQQCFESKPLESDTSLAISNLRHHKLPNETSHYSLVTASNLADTSQNGDSTLLLGSSRMQFNTLSDNDSGPDGSMDVLQKSRSFSSTKSKCELGMSTNLSIRNIISNSSSSTNKNISENEDSIPTTKTALIFPRLDEGLSSDAESFEEEVEEEDEHAMDADVDADDDEFEDDDVEDEDEVEDDEADSLPQVRNPIQLNQANSDCFINGRQQPKSLQNRTVSTLQPHNSSLLSFGQSDQAELHHVKAPGSAYPSYSNQEPIDHSNLKSISNYASQNGVNPNYWMGVTSHQSANLSAQPSTSSQHFNQRNQSNNLFNRDEAKTANRLSSDTDNETDRLLGSQRTDQLIKLASNDVSSNNSAELQPQVSNVIKPSSNSREVLIEGVLFNVKYLGTTQSDCEGRSEKEDRIQQAEMAVHEVKSNQFRNREAQSATEVQLFISTEKIMVLDDKERKILMDHSLRTISYIADIGEAIVLIVRKKSSSNDTTTNSSRPISKISCHVFESSESHTITKSISQAFQVAYTELLKSNGTGDTSSYLPKELDYQEVLNSQEMSTDELEMFARKENQREVIVPKEKGEILGLSIVESGWGSVLPTVVIANLKPDGPAYRCKRLTIGDQILSVNGISLVGLPLAECQEILRKTKKQRVARLSVVPCPITVEVKIKRPDTKYQLGFSVQNGVICSLLRGGIAERGGVRVGHRIMSINGTTVVGVPHEKIVTLLASSVGEIRMKTCLTSLYRLILGEENPVHF